MIDPHPIRNAEAQARAAEYRAMVWRTLYLLTVPPLFVAVCVLTHYVNQHQQAIRQTVTQELSISAR